MVKPRISVVITSFNQKELLAKAIDSVLSQTRPVDEIVIADDSSSDGSQDLIRQYVNSHPDRVVAVLNERNQGTPSNRNVLPNTSGCTRCKDGSRHFVPPSSCYQVRVGNLGPYQADHVGHPLADYPVGVLGRPEVALGLDSCVAHRL